MRCVTLPTTSKSTSKSISETTIVATSSTRTAHRIGILGGTFDPIHNGHLFIAEEGRVRCNLSKVVFVPNNKPAHREGKVAHSDAATRLELVRLAIEDNPHFAVSTVETEREGLSYAFDTIAQLQIEYSNAELFWIVGADTIDEVPTWYRGAEIFEMCRFVAVSRGDFNLEESARSLSESQRARVIFLESVGLPIASRDLRSRIRNGWPLRYLVPDAVERAVAMRGLYR